MDSPAAQPASAPQARSERRERAAVRLTQQFFLRQAELLSGVADGDLLLGLVFIAITTANTAHLAEAPSLEFTELDDVPPDQLRRPISVLALSESLQLPYETTRRYVGRLEALGLARRVGRAGVIVPSDTLEHPSTKERVQRSFADVQRFVAGLRRIGVDVDGMR
jgi:hypothetical protein